LRIDISDEEIQASFEMWGRTPGLGTHAMRAALEAAYKVRKARKKARKQVRALSS